MPLKNEVNDKTTELYVRAAARQRLGVKNKDLRSVYEHGQWWVIVYTDEETLTYSVVDTSDGFDFEQV